MTAAPLARKLSVLANGIPSTVLHRPGADVTTVSVWILAGSRHELVPGVGHLLEHVVMQAVPAGRRLRVVDEIESWGGDANAITSRDHVVLYARVPTPDAGAALSALSAAATMTTVDEDLVDAERRVVVEELRLAAADPTDIVHDEFFTAAYGEHPMGRPVGGTPNGVADLTAVHVTEWAARHIRPEMLGVVVSGGMRDVDVDAVLRDGALAGLVASGPRRPADSAPAILSGRRDLSIVADTAGVVLGGPAFALRDPRGAAAEVVMELLAGGNASVLNEEIRSRRGLSYDVSGAVAGYRDTGVWRVAISTAPERRDEVVDLSVELLRAAVDRGFTADEVAVARRRTAGLLRLEAESSLEEVLLYGDYGYVGGLGDWSPAAHLARLATVDVDQVNRCARLMLGELVVATAGGTDG